MGVTVSSGQTSVTGTVQATGSVPILGTTQTQINIVATGTGAQQNIYTVTTGKTFYLYGIQVGIGYTLTMYKNDGTTALVGTQSGATLQQPVTAAAPIAVYTTAQVVKATNTGNSVYYVWGVEQ